MSANQLEEHGYLAGGPVALGDPRVSNPVLRVPDSIRLVGVAGSAAADRSGGKARVEWEYGPTHDQSNLAGILERFIRLDESRPERVGKFAKKWGPLDICEEHGLPRAHDQRCEISFINQPTLIAENLSDWLRTARAILATLSVAALLQEGQRGTEEQWDEIMAMYGATPKPVPPLWFPIAGESPEEVASAPGKRQEGQLFAVLRQWLSWSGMEIGLQENRDWPPELAAVFGYHHSVLGHIILEMTAAISQYPGIFACNNCGFPYTTKGNRPRVDKRHYCRVCRPEVELRWKRESARRRRKKPKTLIKGESKPK